MTFATAALYLHGVNLDPRAATKALEVAPSESWKRGDTSKTPAGSDITRRGGLWALRISAEDVDVVVLLEKLLAVIEPKSSSIRGICNLEEAYIDLYVAASAENKSHPTSFIEFESSVLESLNHVGLRVKITHSFSVTS